MNESTWIIDGSNELIVDFLFALVLFLDSTQPRPFKNPKQIFFFGSNKRMTCKSNSNAKPNPGQHHSSFHLLLHSNAGLVFLFILICTLCSEIMPQIWPLPSIVYPRSGPYPLQYSSRSGHYLGFRVYRAHYVFSKLFADFGFLSVQSGIYSVQTSLWLS